MSDNEPDMTDDWMNPPSSTSYVFRAPQPGDPKEYLIERQKKRICFGDPGYILDWEYWDKFDSAEKRDAALAKIREQHPMWILRKRDVDPYLDYIRTRVRF